MLLASVVGSRSLTLTLAVLGLVMAPVGLAASWRKRRLADRIWLALGATLSGVVLVLVLYAPGKLNDLWALDIPVAQSDRNQLLRVPRNNPMSPGQPLSAEDWVDSGTELIRQDDVIVRIVSVQTGPVPDKGECFLVHLQIRNSNNQQTIALTPLSNDQHKPVLTDDSGRSYPFLEARPKDETSRGTPVQFRAPDGRGVELAPRTWLDCQLVFTPPPAGVGTLKLEVPTSAWGRKAVCKFRLPGAL